MRLWHTKLIKALPNMHLQSQWRELSAIAGAIQKNGTPNHVLVNFVLDYDYDTNGIPIPSGKELSIGTVTLTNGTYSEAIGTVTVQGTVANEHVSASKSFA